MSDTCGFYALLLQLMPFLCVLAFSRAATSRGLLWITVSGITLYHVTNLTLALVLGSLGVLTPLVYRGAILALMVGFLLSGLGGARILLSEVRRIRYSPQWVDLIIAVALLVAAWNIYVEYRFGWARGPVYFDAAHYHIPRALLWSWHGTIDPFDTSEWVQIGLPVGGSASLLPTVFVGCGWLGGNFSTLVLALGGACAIALIGRGFGLPGRALLLAALAFLSFPVVGLRLSDVSTDLASTYLVLAAIALARTTSLRTSLLLYPLLVGAAIACKQYAGFVAVPAALALFLPRGREIARDPRSLYAGMLGTVVGMSLLALSLRPTVVAFNDIMGGRGGREQSTLEGGWDAVKMSLSYYTLITVSDVVNTLPDSSQAAIFSKRQLANIFEYLGLYPGLIAGEFHQERSVTGVLSVLFLPWLLFGVRAKRRLLALSALVVIFAVNFAPLNPNPVGARFFILPLAAFALLWGARAASRPLVVSLLVTGALVYDCNYLERRGRDRVYDPQAESNRELSPIVRSEPILLMAADMSQDSFTSGRLGQVRFEYASCPRDGNWSSAFRSYRQNYKWFLFSLKDEQVIPGAAFESAFGPPCKKTTLENLRQALRDAGWSLHQRIDSMNSELWISE